MKFVLCFVILVHSSLGKILSHNCDITVKKTGVKTATCTNRQLQYVPYDLPRDISTLDLSNNEIKKLVNDTFKNYTKLLELKIDNNILNTLEPFAFSGLEQLLNLSMSANELELSKSYPRGIFSFLKSLKILDIRRNSVLSSVLTSLFYPYFGDLMNLTHLYIDLWKRPNFTYSGLKYLFRLKVVRFENCFLVEMKNETLAEFPAGIEQIYFTNFNELIPYVSVVENDFLKHFQNLQVLSFDNINCEISKPLHLLYPFANKSMEAIIYKRVITGYENAVFITEKMTSYLRTICVKTLVLAQNEIVDFEPKSLLSYRYPQCLENIVFSGNRFSIASDNKIRYLMILMSQLINLKAFDFSYNPLRYIRVKYMQLPYFNSELVTREACTENYHSMQSNIMEPTALPKVFYKALNRNSRTSLNIQSMYADELHKAKPTAKNTDLKVDDKPTLIFAIPRSLETLRLSHYMADGIFHNQRLIINNASSLRHLDMSYYQMNSFPGIIVNGSVNIEYLDISGIDSGIVLSESSIPFFRKATTVLMRDTNLGETLRASKIVSKIISVVKKLDISNNNIWFMDESTFTEGKYLKHLIISNNILFEIPIAITHVKTLQVLDIRNNQLQSINVTVRSWMDRQVRRNTKGFSLHIEGNIFTCNCGTSDFVQWMFQTEVLFDHRNRSYACRLNNGSIIDTIRVNREFHEFFGHCNSGVWLQIGIWCLFAFITVIVLVAIAFNFRWQILCWFYRRFKKVVEKELQQKYKYDIYLSYADDSVIWIKHSLVPKIENSWKMKICIEDRDILGGEIFADAIAKAIEESRYIILVISAAFKDREWGDFEIERAKFEKYTKNVQKIIVIEKGVSMKDFPIKQLEKVWQDITIIKWSDIDSESGWNELRMTLFSQLI